MKRAEISDLIFRKMENNSEQIKKLYQSSTDRIGYFFIDDLLPVDVAMRIYKSFPSASNMVLKKSLREYKYIAAQMNHYDDILEEVIYAFQDPRIVNIISEVCQLKNLYPDEHLYAGGISLMGNKQYLNPHLDNSHDKDRDRWRALNLLYYVTPEWPVTGGGNLELWPDGPKGQQITVHSKFNRLVVMATHASAWHSVSPINVADRYRCCVSNYYFSDSAVRSDDTFHVTSFRGRPEQPVRDVVLKADIALRMSVRKFFKKGIVENKHVYKKDP